MYQYSIIEWLFFFYLYCFFGWIFESTFVSLKSRQDSKQRIYAGALFADLRKRGNHDACGFHAFSG